MQNFKKMPVFLYVLYLSLAASLPTKSIAASLYTITEIGNLTFLSQQQTQSLKMRINDNNQVVGWHNRTFSSKSPIVAFTWDSNQQFQTPLALEIPTDHAILNINNTNNTVGYSSDANGNIAVMWGPNFDSRTNLGGTNSQATAINASNQIAVNSEVGKDEDGNSISQPFIWDNGSLSIVPINNPQGGTGDAMNDNGWLVGETFLSPSQAFIWDGIDMLVLNQLNQNIAASWAAGINNLNDVVGGMQIFLVDGSINQQNLRTRAFQWNKSNGLIDLSANINGPSWANAINGKQQIVGGQSKDIRFRRALLWQDDTAFDLNQIVVERGNWTLMDASDINAAGNIVGIGSRDEGLFYAFLLEPLAGTAVVSDLEISLKNISIGSKTGISSRTLDAAQEIVYTITNHGPDDATNVFIESTLDPSINATKISISRGTCSTPNNQLVFSCETDLLAVGEQIEMSLSVETQSQRFKNIVTTVDAIETDAGPNANNAITKSVRYLPKTEPQESTSPIDDTSNDAGSDTGNDESNSTPIANTDTEANTIGSSFSTSGGCSLGSNQPFDPLLPLLALLAFLKLRKLRRNTLLGIH